MSEKSNYSAGSARSLTTCAASGLLDKAGFPGRLCLDSTGKETGELLAGELTVAGGGVCVCGRASPGETRLEGDVGQEGKWEAAFPGNRALELASRGGQRQTGC